MKLQQLCRTVLIAQTGTCSEMLPPSRTTSVLRNIHHQWHHTLANMLMMRWSQRQYNHSQRFPESLGEWMKISRAKKAGIKKAKQRHQKRLERDLHQNAVFWFQLSIQHNLPHETELEYHSLYWPSLQTDNRTVPIGGHTSSTLVLNIGQISNNDETSYREEINSLAEWCTESNLLLNVSKTKELISFPAPSQSLQTRMYWDTLWEMFVQNNTQKMKRKMLK